MSGIAGICFHDGRHADPRLVGRMLDALAHRGPDAAAIWCGGSVGFGHRLLRTAPEDAADSQPLVDHRANLAITADARLDNRDELARLLGRERDPAPPSDAELILRAYERWGTACPAHLLGDFAFAIRDGRRGSIFCARDQMGVRPLYYHRSSGIFCFASEMKALLALDEVPRRLNETRLSEFLVSMHADRESTFFRDIVRLPPAHFAVVAPDAHRIERYWALDETRALHLASDDAYAESFLELFTESVRCRLRSAAPVAALLSGGLDSSSIVGVGSRLLSASGAPPLTTYSVVFDRLAECDESRYIRAVVDRSACRANLVPFDHDAHHPIGDARAIVQALDEPAFVPNASQPWQLYTRIARDGGRVVLDGHGGDETVSQGYGLLKELARRGRWLSLARELRGVSRSEDLGFGSLLSSYVAFGLEPIVGRSTPLRLTRRAWRAARRRLRGVPAPGAAPRSPLDLVAPSFARSAGLADRYREWRRKDAAFHDERRDHLRAVANASQPAALEVLNAHASAFSLELRFPFWDRRLVSFCIALPAGQKRRGAAGRLVLRRSMEGVLPPDVQWRHGKTNFFPSVTSGLKLNEGAELARLREEIGKVESFVDPAAFRVLCDRVTRGDPSPDDYYALSRVSSLVYWLESGMGRLLTG